MTALTAAAGWVLIASSPGTYRITLGSQGPVWLSGVVTSAPSDDDYSTYVIDGDQSLDFTLATDDELYARAKRNQTVTATELPAASDFEAIAASVEALSALVGSDADDAGDPTVFGLTKQVATNTAAPANWWPENAKAYIDFLNGRAWTVEDGEVAISTLLGTDANANNAWGEELSYVPGEIAELGYDGNQGVAFIGSARTRILAGSTIRIQMHMISSGGGLVLLVVDDGDEGIDITYDKTGDQIIASAWNGPFSETVGVVWSEDAVNVVAATLTPSRAEVAVNGVLKITDTLTSDDWPTTGGDALVAAMMDIEDGDHIQTITIYDALPDTTGLAALSVVIP